MTKAEKLYWFFSNFQDHMMAKHRKGPARFALKMKSKYFRVMKGSETK